jgi:hypothetical protein
MSLRCMGAVTAQCTAAGAAAARVRGHERLMKSGIP